jgi:hypothetical protein
MNITRFALVTAVATTALWAAKAVAIGLAGGLGKSPAEGPLFLLGLVSCVVAAVATGIAVGRPRRTWAKVAWGLAGFLVIAVVGAVAGAVVTAVQPSSPGWAWGEINLWAMALAVLAVNLSPAVHRAPPAPAEVRRTSSSLAG